MNLRLRSLRLARGLSMDALVERLEGRVTKMTLSRYERGLTRPSAEVLAHLAAALEVAPADLAGGGGVSVRFLCFRKRSNLTRKEEQRILEAARLQLEVRIQVQELLMPGERPDLPRRYLVRTPAEAESAAADLRRRWDLGTAPLRGLTSELERRLVHVLEVESTERFDGLSALVSRSEGGETVGAAVVVRRMDEGERQRMSLAHELGHVVMTPAGDMDEEKAAFRFAGAFLAPPEAVYARLGRTRRAVVLEELLELRETFGLSMQAMLMRLRALEVISEDHARQWWKFFSHWGMRRHEGDECPAERSTWLASSLRRAVAEDLIAREDAETILANAMAAAGDCADGARLGMTGPERRRIPPDTDPQAEAGTERDGSSEPELVSEAPFEGMAVRETASA